MILVDEKKLKACFTNWSEQGLLDCPNCPCQNCGCGSSKCEDDVIQYFLTDYSKATDEELNSFQKVLAAHTIDLDEEIYRRQRIHREQEWNEIIGKLVDFTHKYGFIELQNKNLDSWELNSKFDASEIGKINL